MSEADKDRGASIVPRPIASPPSGGADDGAPASAAVTAARHRGLVGTPRAWAALTFDSLQVRDYRLLWLGMLLSMGGMQMQMFTRGLQAYDLTSNGFLTSVVTMGWAPTMLALSLFGGVLGDRMERRSLIQFVQIGTAVIAGTTAALTYTHTVHWTHLLAVSMFQGCLFALQMPARQAVIPKIVGRERVSNALALNASSMGLMSFIAPALAGGIYESAGPGGSYVAAVVLNIIAIAFTSRLPKMPPEKKDGPRRSTASQIADGLSYIRRTPMVRTLLLQGVFITLLAQPFMMLIQVFAKHAYHASASQIGMLSAANGIGALIGALAIAGLRQGNRGAILLWSSVLAGVGLLLAAAYPIFAIGLVALVLSGFGQSGRMALGQSLQIEQSEDEYRARVMSVSMMTFGLMPLAVLPLGAAYDAVGASIPVFIMGGLLLAVSFYYLITQTKLRRLP